MRQFFKIIGITVLSIFALVLIILAIFYKSHIPIEELEKEYFTEQSEYVEIDGTSLHIRKMGSGPPVLLIHGSFSSLHTWDYWQKHLANDFTTIAVDLPGHGLTGPNPKGLYDTDYYADLLWRLMDQLSFDTIAIAGNSMGGKVSYKMALQREGSVSKMILLNSSGVPYQVDTAKFKTENKFSVFTLINHPVFSRLMTSITPKFLFKMSMEQVYYDQSKITQQQIQRYYDLMLRKGNREATLAKFKQRKPSQFDNLKDLQIPTFIMWGEHDKWIPVAHARKFDKILPNSKLKIYPNAGHVPMEEIPAQTATDALNFLTTKLNF